jgi:hypothetical protein
MSTKDKSSDEFYMYNPMKDKRKGMRKGDERWDNLFLTIPEADVGSQSTKSNSTKPNSTKSNLTKPKLTISKSTKPKSKKYTLKNLKKFIFRQQGGKRRTRKNKKRTTRKRRH